MSYDAPAARDDTASVARSPAHQLVVAGGLALMLGFDEAREYIDSVPVPTRIPGAPAWLLGAFAHEGLALPLVDIDCWAGRSERSSEVLRVRALRFDDGVRAWAIRVDAAPSVADIDALREETVFSRLPLSVSSRFGPLMAHARRAWIFDSAAGRVALQLRWPDVAAELRTQLSGA